MDLIIFRGMQDIVKYLTVKFSNQNFGTLFALNISLLKGGRMFNKFKNQKGFSLIELLVVVVIIAILAAIAVPIYMSYVRKARATEAQTAIAAIRSAYRVHYQTYGTTDNYRIEDAKKTRSKDAV